MPLLNRTSNSFRWMALVLTAAVLGTAVWQQPAESAGADEKTNLAKFMRKKLDASSKILEGLTVEDTSLIKEGSAAILEMSKSELWNVLLDEDYREYNRDFRSSMRKLEQAAADNNLDNALLQWNDAVKGCVECHKYVRAQRATAK